MGSFSKIFGAYGALAGEAVEGFLNLVLQPNMTLDDLAKVYSGKLDDIILKEATNKLKYVGGTFNINYLNSNSFDMSYELFFQDVNKEWVKKDAKSQPQKLAYLTKEAQAELAKEKKISFEIDPPKEKSVKQAETTEQPPKLRKMPTTDE